MFFTNPDMLQDVITINTVRYYFYFIFTSLLITRLSLVCLF